MLINLGCNTYGSSFKITGSSIRICASWSNKFLLFLHLSIESFYVTVIGKEGCFCWYGTVGLFAIFARSYEESIS